MFIPRRVARVYLFLLLCFLGGVIGTLVRWHEVILPALGGGAYRRTSGYPEIVYAPDCTRGPYVTADSAILIDRETGTVLYAKNEHVRRPPASTTKIMTALVALERGNLDSTVVVSPRAAGVEGSSLYLRPRDRIKLRDLLRGIMLRSGNDGCVAIAEHIAGSVEAFVDMMNRKARQIGAWDTHFMNPHGLHHPNHYSSAFDLALMARYGLSNPEFAEFVRTREGAIELTYNDQKEKRQLANTNWLLWSFEGADGVKTGTTSAAGYCLVASATRQDRSFICVVLHSDSRWSDAARLLEYGFNEFDVIRVAQRGAKAARWPVKGGVAGEVDLIAASDFKFVVRRSQAHLVDYKFVEERKPNAPIRKGEVLGRLVVSFDGDEIGYVDLIASEAVPRKTFWRSLIEGLVLRGRKR